MERLKMDETKFLNEILVLRFTISADIVSAKQFSLHLHISCIFDE